MKKKVVIALGGNAILQPKEAATYNNQLQNVETSAEQIVAIKAAGFQVIVVHGNGPQVGNILRQNEEAKNVASPMPIDVCSAQSQGFIGYMLERLLKNQLHQRNVSGDVVCLLTQTEVASNDPAFKQPTKPIGGFFTFEKAEELRKTNGWVMGEDAGRGYRRLVPSPLPLKIHGVETVQAMSDLGAIVISTGGGGIPVYRDEAGLLQGTEAVIDKDRSALRLSQQIQADVLMILTDVPYVYLNYGKKEQKQLTTISLAEAETYMAAGHFAAGSMGPKMEAAIAFAKDGKEAIICSLDHALAALQGKGGTRIKPAN